MNPIFSILGGRKNFLVILGIVITVLMRYIDPEGLTSEQLVEWVTALTGLGVAGHAIEGGLEKLGGNGKKPA